MAKNKKTFDGHDDSDNPHVHEVVTSGMPETPFSPLMLKVWRKHDRPSDEGMPPSLFFRIEGNINAPNITTDEFIQQTKESFYNAVKHGIFEDVEVFIDAQKDFRKLKSGYNNEPANKELLSGSPDEVQKKIEKACEEYNRKHGIPPSN
jgi:hypothetical protein